MLNLIAQNYHLTFIIFMNQKGTGKLILHLHQLHLKSDSQPFNLKFVIFQGQQNAQTKLESRKQITLTNNKALIQQAFQLTLTKDGKILMIILKTKMKQTSFLGQISIDANRYIQQGLETINLQSAVSKCASKDDNARLLLTLTFPQKKQPLREFEIERVMNKEHQQKQIKPNIMMSTESVASKCQSQSTIKNEKTKRLSTDFQRKNYVRIGQYKKNLQILRQDKKEKSRQESKSRERSGSYKKRFEYQEGMKTKAKNTIVFMKQKKEKIKQVQPAPVARQKTPEPIRLDKLSSSCQSKSRQQSKGKSIRPRQTTQRSSQKPDKMFISIHAKTERYQTESDAVNDQREHTFSINSSIKSGLEVSKEENLADKMQLILTRIEDKKSIQRSYDQYIGASNSKSKSKSNSKSNASQKSPIILQDVFPLTSNDKVKNSDNKSNDSSLKPQVKIEEFKHEENRQSICTFGDAVKLSNQSDIPTGSKLKINELQSKILNLQAKIKNLEQQKTQSQILIQKLSIRYEKLVEQIQSVRDPYQKEINQLKQQLKKLRKPRQSPIELELKNQKRKVLNLQNTLLLKDNEIKHLKLGIASLQDERKDLQVHLAKKQFKMGHNSSRALLEAEIMASGYPSAVKSQNQLLRSQNQLLQKHIEELNELVEQVELHNSRAINNLKEKQIEDLKQMNQLLNQNIEVQSQKTIKLERQLRRTKMNFAEMMNVVFQKGGDELVERIEKKIMERDSSGYISSSDVE